MGILNPWMAVACIVGALIVALVIAGGEANAQRRSGFDRPL